MPTQREAVHLDHALAGVELPEDAAPPPGLAELMAETLRDGSPEKLKSLVIAIQKFNKGSVQEFQETGEKENINIDGVLADRKIFDALFELGAAPASYETFTRILMYDHRNPLGRLFRSEAFARWFIKKAHWYGMAASALFAAVNHDSLTGANFERAMDESGARSAMMMVMLMVLLPALMGIFIRTTSGRMLKIDEIIRELERETDRKAAELHKTLRCLVMLHQQRDKTGPDEDAQKKILAKIQLVRCLVQKALSADEGDEPVLEPEEYGGKLDVGNNTVLRTLEIDFPEVDY